MASVASWDDTARHWAVAQLVALVLTAAAFITWFALTYRAAERNNPQLLRHAWGWSIGAWFVPFLSLVRGPQMVNDALNALERPADDYGWSRPGYRLVTAWWTTFVLGNVLAQFDVDPQTFDNFRDSSRFEELSDLLQVVAAVLAMVLVGRLTAAAERRRAELTARLSSAAA